MLENFIPKDYPDFIEHGTPLCAETFPDAFFTDEKSETVVLVNGKERTRTWARYDYEKEAKALCGECPYKARCLEFALKNHEQGIWGGTTERDRRKLISALNLTPNKRGRAKVQ
jgi:hypothetical protein